MFGSLQTIKKEAVLNACILDYCHCNLDNRQQCVCNGMAVFARECQFQGVDLKQDWRDMDRCRMYQTTFSTICYARLHINLSMQHK